MFLPLLPLILASAGLTLFAGELERTEPCLNLPLAMNLSLIILFSFLLAQIPQWLRKFSKLPRFPEVRRGQRMELWKLRFEGKHDSLQGDGGLFLRWSISKNLLDTQGSLRELKGNGGYLGIGWEFPFEILGLDFEIAQRQFSMENNLFIKTSSPSIGVHFYKHL